jgi:hypothetical protein
MRSTRVGAALMAAGLAVGCGQGRAIFNVDVYSWLKGSGEDTVAYAIPPATSGTASNAPQEIKLPGGLGSSIVDSVRITGSADLVNTGGTGTIGFRLYLDSTSAGTNNPSALAIDVPPASVSGVDTVPLAISGDVSGALKDLFTASTLWVRVEAVVDNPGVTAVTGQMVLTALEVHAVFQDKIF